MSLWLNGALGVWLLLGIVGSAYGQPAPVLGVGLAIPEGPLGQHRNPGPLVRLGITFGSPTRALQSRFDGEVAFMPGEGGPDSWSGSHFTSIAALANLIVGGRGDTTPYWLVGGGIQRLVASGVRNPYGLTPGLRTGFGVRGRVRTMRVSLELIAHLNITDFAAGDFQAGYFYPVVAGLRF